MEQSGDYTNYSRGVYADYYQCYGKIRQDADMLLAELVVAYQRAESPHAKRISAEHAGRLAGARHRRAFYEDNKLFDQTSWMYKSIPECTADLATGCFTDLGTFPGSTVTNSGVQPSSTSFYQDTHRETKQTAFFARPTSS